MLSFHYPNIWKDQIKKLLIAKPTFGLHFRVEISRDITLLCNNALWLFKPPRVTFIIPSKYRITKSIKSTFSEFVMKLVGNQTKIDWAIYVFINQSKYQPICWSFYVLTNLTLIAIYLSISIFRFITDPGEH